MKEKIKKIVDRIWKLTDDFSYDIIHSEEKKPFINIKPFFLDKETTETFSFDNTHWIHSEYIKKINKKIIIEPDYSYCITDFNKIIKSSAFYPKLTPSFPRYLKALIKRDFKKVPQAILFDGQVGTNYFHFFSDVISKIELIKKINKCEELPIIIGERTFNTKFFQYYLENTDLKKYNWLVQKQHQYIEVEELYLVKPMPYKKEYFQQIRALLKLPKCEPNKRVFLNRSFATGRYIENFNEIESILKKYNFEIIDTNNATLLEQANLFNSIKYLVSIHGAGETNILFSTNELSFLEINPANRISCQYYWMSIELSIKYYDVILGKELSNVHIYPEGGFYLDPDKLERAINKMLNYTKEKVTEV